MAVKQSINLNLTQLTSEDWIRNQLKSQKAVLPTTKYNMILKGVLTELKNKYQESMNNSNKEITTGSKSNRSTHILQIQQSMLPHRVYFDKLKTVIEMDVLNHSKLNGNFTSSEIIHNLLSAKKIEIYDEKLFNDSDSNNNNNNLLEGSEKTILQKKYEYECAFTHTKNKNNNIQFRFVLNNNCSYTNWYTVDQIHLTIIEALIILRNINEYLNDLILAYCHFKPELLPLEIELFTDEFKQELERHRKTFNQTAALVYEFVYF